MSEGTPSESGAYADARAGLSHLIEVRGIPEQRIVLFGRSLGATVAVNLARNRELAGVILESAFTSAADVVRGMMGAPMAYLVRGRFDSANKIGQIRAPLLFFHGDHDEIIDYALGRRLFELAPEPKQFETIPGAGHNDTIDVGGRPYFSRHASGSSSTRSLRSSEELFRRFRTGVWLTNGSPVRRSHSAGIDPSLEIDRCDSAYFGQPCFAPRIIAG